VHAAYLIKFIKDELSRKIKFYKREARTRRWRLIARENYESFIKNFIYVLSGSAPYRRNPFYVNGMVRV